MSPANKYHKFSVRAHYWAPLASIFLSPSFPILPPPLPPPPPIKSKHPLQSLAHRIVLYMPSLLCFCHDLPTFWAIFKWLYYFSIEQALNLLNTTGSKREAIEMGSRSGCIVWLLIKFNNFLSLWSISIYFAWISVKNHYFAWNCQYLSINTISLITIIVNNCKIIVKSFIVKEIFSGY